MFTLDDNCTTRDAARDYNSSEVTCVTLCASLISSHLRRRALLPTVARRGKSSAPTRLHRSQLTFSPFSLSCSSLLRVMMTASDQLTAPAALNPFHSKDVPQPPTDSVPAYTRSPGSSSAQGAYSSLPTVDQLEFQNIAHTGSQGQISVDIPSASDSLPGSSSTSSLNASSSSPSSASATYAPFYSLNYYKPYFDITTDVLFSRMLRAVNPVSTTLYTDDANPDLYGPFWITSTLCLLVAVCSNLATYIDEHYIDVPFHNPGEEVATWQYDFDKLSVAVSVFYSLITWVPLVYFFLLTRAGQPKGLIELICVQGYSFSVLLAVCLLMLIPNSVWQWVVVAVGAVVQCWFVVKNVWTDRSVAAVMPVATGIAAIQVGLALLFRW